MVKREMANIAAEGKPPRKRRTATQDRYSFHTCFHYDAWAGIIDLDDGERGVYWSVILLMYMRRSPLPLDYAWLARQCNISLQKCRARVASLEKKGRLVVDRENGVIYDDRAVRELVSAERFSESQSERAKQRWNDTASDRKPKLQIVKSEPNVAPASAAARDFVGGLTGGLERSWTRNESHNQENLECRAHANQNPESIDEPPTESSVPSARRSPLNSGGAPKATDPYPPVTDPKARLDAMRSALREAYPQDGTNEPTEQGKDEGAEDVAAAALEHAADRKAVRR